MLACETKDYGPETEREESIAEVSSLVLNGNFSIQISQGDREELLMKGPEELLESITVSQEEGQLTIEQKKDMEIVVNDQTVEIELVLPQLSLLEFNGAGKLVMEPYFEAENFRLICNGAGKLELNLEANDIHATVNMVGDILLKGSTDTFFLRNDGMGKVDASELFANKLDLYSSGIGSVKVFAEETIAMEVSGIGKVSHSGNAEVIKKNVSGIGKVEREEGVQKR